MDFLPVTRLRAVEAVRKMTGGSRPYLFRCDDGHEYVLKSQSSRGTARTLLNELLGSLLLQAMKITVPEFALVEVSRELIALTPELAASSPGCVRVWTEGLCFGSRFQGTKEPCYDLLPQECHLITNPDEFLGVFVFDSWALNTDERQVVYRRSDQPGGGYRAMFIDHEFCFGGRSWNINALDRFRGVSFPLEPYLPVEDLTSFAPWIARIEAEMTSEAVASALLHVPKEWKAGQMEALQHLLRQLNRARLSLRRRVAMAWELYADKISNWRSRSSVPGTHTRVVEVGRLNG